MLRNSSKVMVSPVARILYSELTWLYFISLVLFGIMFSFLQWDLVPSLIITYCVMNNCIIPTFFN